MRETIRDAGMLRDEARFALAFAAILLAIGFAVALGYAMAAMNEDPLAHVGRGALFGGPLILTGWIACRYAAWRLEEAIAIETGRPKRSLRSGVRALRRQGAAVLRRLRRSPPVLAARAAERQQTSSFTWLGNGIDLLNIRLATFLTARSSRRTREEGT